MYSIPARFGASLCKARDKATLDAVAERYSEWTIDGEPEPAAASRRAVSARTASACRQIIISDIDVDAKVPDAADAVPFAQELPQFAMPSCRLRTRTFERHLLS
jgi:hypothetical protein